MSIQSIYNANYLNSANMYGNNYNNYSQNSNGSNNILSIFSMLISALMGGNSNSLFGQNSNSSIFGQNLLGSTYPGVNINNTGNIGNINIEDLLTTLTGETAVEEETTTPIAVDQTTTTVTPKEKTLQEMSNVELQTLWDSGDTRQELGDEIHIRYDQGDSSMHDPYELNIDGKKYIFTQDKNNNSKVDGKQEILGINDKKDNLFADMKSLDTDKDGSVTSEELKAANVSLNEVLNGVLTVNKFDVNKIDKLDLSSFKAVDNKNETGTFGTFSVKLKNGAMVQGAETFEDQKYFDKLLKK